MTQNRLIAKMARKKCMQTEKIARSQFNSQGYIDPGIDCSNDVVITKQSFKDECDINNILKKYEVTGQLTHMIEQQPEYGDFANVPDYMESMAVVTKAQSQFEGLNAHIRARFDNDPAKFLAFATDKNNLEEMRSLGLAKQKLSDAPVKAVEASSPSSEQVPSEGTQ